MDHPEFIQSWGAGQLEIDVDRTKALQVANSKILPKRYQVAHAFWSWIWILSIPSALATMYFYAWWAGLLLLVFLTPILSRSIKKSAMQFMIDHALESPEFYKIAVSEEIFRVRQKSQ